jgi:membrane associated rhomboid family serine protease
VTAEETSLDEIYITAEGLIGWVSWLIWLGFYPIASEALGGRKPHATRVIAAITVLASILFLASLWTDSSRMQTMKNLMLWAGDRAPSAQELLVAYTYMPYGDSVAFYDKCYEIEEANPELREAEVVLAAHKALRPEQQCFGQYRTSQLITHAFLHGGILHLAGNLVFLLVFGSRINAVIGNVLTPLLYLVLAVGAALAHVASMAEAPATPMIGASGAVMGLAGMYFVLFPIHQVHMAAWLRWFGYDFTPRLSLKMWSMRGYWVVLFYIAFDVLYTAFGIEDNVAHWAHLGGFGVGAGIALIMLLSRTINARGCDIISAILGKRAWALVGRPNRDTGVVQRLP